MAESANGRRGIEALPDRFRVMPGRSPRQQIKAVFLHPAILAGRGWAPYTPAVATRAGGLSPSIDVWLLPAPARLLAEPAPLPYSSSVWLSASVWSALFAAGRPAEDADAIDLHLAPDWIRTAPARIEHVLKGGQIMLHRHDAERLLAGQRWAIVTHRGTPMAAEVARSDRAEDSGLARLSFYTRLLLGVEEDQFSDLGVVQVAPFRQSPAPSNRLRSSTSAIRLHLAPARLLALLVEVVLRPLLRAPVVALRVSESSVGDDAFHVVRIRDDVLPLLGVRPGDEVFVSFGPGRQVAALTLSANATPLPAGFRTRVVDPGGREDVALDERLLIGVPAPLRDALGVPRSAVVHVRRRLSTAVLGRVNELVLPVGALIVTALTVPRFPAVLAVVGGVVVTMLSLLPLRLRQPARGRWPW